MRGASAAWVGLTALALALLGAPRSGSAQAHAQPAQPTQASTPAAPSASEPSYALAPGVLRATSASGTRDVALGCEGVALLRDGARLYVACGARGVVVLSLADPTAPVVEGYRDFGGDVVALFSGGGRVWAQIARIEARPIDAALDASTAQLQSNPTLPPVPAAPANALTPPGYADLAAPSGARDGFAPLAAPAGGVDLIMPERVGGIWRVGASADLFLPIGTIGVGGLLDAYVTRHFDGPFMLRAQISPLAFALVDTGGGSAFGAHLLFGLDTQFLELALGVGASTTDAADSAFSLLQSLRIGALDGLHLAVQTDVFVLDKQFEFGAVSGSLQIPVKEGWWLLLRGGGGPMGFAFGDVGVRYRVSGDGGAGSFFLQGMLGGVALFGGYVCSSTGYCSSQDSGGPALGVGVEWRL